jgi:hypothetical protein
MKRGDPGLDGVLWGKRTFLFFSGNRLTTSVKIRIVPY